MTGPFAGCHLRLESTSSYERQCGPLSQRQIGPLTCDAAVHEGTRADSARPGKSPRHATHGTEGRGCQPRLRHQLRVPLATCQLPRRGFGRGHQISAAPNDVRSALRERAYRRVSPACGRVTVVPGKTKPRSSRRRSRSIMRAPIDGQGRPRRRRWGRPVTALTSRPVRPGAGCECPRSLRAVLLALALDDHRVLGRAFCAPPMDPSRR